MKRRQFLRNTLALGAAGLLPNTGHASSVSGNLLLDAVPLQSDDTNRVLVSECRQGAGEFLTQEEVERRLLNMLCAFPADVILINEQREAVSLQYDEKTMTAPVILAKGNAEQFLNEAAASNIPLAIVGGKFWIRFVFIKTMPTPPACQAKCYDDWLIKLGYTPLPVGNIYNTKGIAKGSFTQGVQDIFDTLDVDDVIPEKHYELIAEVLNNAYHVKQEKAAADRPPIFRLDGALVLVSRRGINVTLRYNKKTMVAPEILGKGEAAPLLEEFAKGKSRVFAEVKVPSNSPFGEMLHSLNHVRCFVIDEQDESVVQDLHDNLNIFDVIPKRHYENVARILESNDLAERRLREQGRGEILSREEIENWLDMMSNG